MVSLYVFAALVHSRLKILPPSLQHNLLLRDTFIAWREIQKKLGLSLFVSIYLPIYEAYRQVKPG